LFGPFVPAGPRGPAGRDATGCIPGRRFMRRRLANGRTVDVINSASDPRIPMIKRVAQAIKNAA